jgi:hypothetical protein
VVEADTPGGGDVHGSGAAAAEAFFDLANAPVVRYTVIERRESSSNDGCEQKIKKVELLVEQDQSLHNSCGHGLTNTLVPFASSTLSRLDT